MSPASQGALEVERYIGSCLISSTVRPSMHKDLTPKKPSYSGKGSYAGEQCTWAGSPLISMTSTPRRSNQQRSSPSPLAQQQQQQCNGSVEPPISSAHLHNKSPLVRLAIHTQGAPLILASRFHNRGKAHGGAVNSTPAACVVNNLNANVANMSARCPVSRNSNSVDQRKPQSSPAQSCPKDSAPTNNVTNIDSLSVASDESSNNSENSLPRIIKPRKRRKKDRKPPNAVLASEVNKHSVAPEEPANMRSGCANEQLVPPKTSQTCYESTSVIATTSTTTTTTQGHYRGQRRPTSVVSKDNVYGRLHPSAQEIVDTRQQQQSQPRYAYRHVQVKVLDDNRNVIVPVPVCQLKGYQTSPNVNLNSAYRYPESVSSEECFGGCQCRYCEPSALLWDVERGSPYGSQYLAAYPARQLPVFLSPYAATCHKQLFDENHHPGVCLHRDGVALLRRSWSDPVSYFSEEIVAPPRADVGVIGDRGQSELRSRSAGAWRPDVSSPASDANSTTSSVLSASGAPGSQGLLEVSTEIVTSPNGHRDLEIKFYSSSPSSTTPEEDKSAFGFPEDDGEEEFSDIWSYHESKLQQDFRTLLQAEE